MNDTAAPVIPPDNIYYASVSYDLPDTHLSKFFEILKAENEHADEKEAPSNGERAPL